MLKYISFLLVLLFVGCGGSSEGSASLNPFNLKVFDPYTEDEFNNQWHLKVVDNSSISKNSHINIYKAWEYTRGANVKVAVIDYDFNPYNKDIKQNIYQVYDVESDTFDVKKDKDSHGTSVASIIAASKNNYGTLGVAPDAKLILIGADLTVDWQRVKAFRKAKEFGADVICCSWGYGISQAGITDELKEAIKDAHDSGITVVFSSGNNAGLDLDDGYDDESELPYVIGVGATTEQNIKADYSNYGDNIDILAPGGSANFGLYTDDYYDTQFHYFSGTSAATPVVAGVVALIKSINHNLTPDQIREILIKTADKIEPDVAHYDTDGFSHTHAYGKVNASTAVAEAMKY